MPPDRVPGGSAIDRALLCLILLFPLPFMFQGLDFTDQGYWVTNYENVFRAPASVASAFGCWLTVILGAIWMKLTSPLGLLGARLGYAVVMSLSAWIVYVTLRRSFASSRRSLLWAVLAATAYANFDAMGAMNWLSYNDLSALFFFWAAYHVLRGVVDDRPAQLAAAGAIMAVNVLVRLPNLVGVLLGLAIPFHSAIVQRPLRRTWLQLGAACGGLLGGLLAMLILLLALGQLSDYVGAVRELLALTGQAGDAHGSHQIILGLLVDNFSTLEVGLYVLPLVGLLYGAGRLIGRIPSRIAVTALALATGMLLYRYDVPVYSRLRGLVTVRWLWSYTGVIYLPLVGLACLPLPGLREQPARRTAALLGLLIVALVPVGSGRTLLNAHYGATLGIAVIGSYLFDLRARDHSMLFLQVACATTVFAFCAHGLWDHVYRDAQDRTLLHASIRHPRLWGIRTKPSRARSVEELVEALPRYVHRDDYLIAFEYAPMVHYLSDTRPYLYNPNPMYYTDRQFSAAIARAEREIPQLPVIVAAKGGLNIGWPDDIAAGLPTSPPKFGVMRRDLAAFKMRHGYQKRWEGSFFELWTSVVAH